VWALPDINRLNATAAANAAKLRRQARSKRKPACEYYGCPNRATMSYLTYDIFSDDPKGAIHLCEHHDGYSGDPIEGYFTCARCTRVMAENYTWERYVVELDGEQICLKCAAEEYFTDPDNWIAPSAITQVVLSPGGVPLFDPAGGVLNIARCRHVLGVKQPVPPGIEFVDNAEFDSMDGHQISGDDLVDVIKRLDQPFCPVLDAAYQFAVSIGIYVRNGQQQEQAQKEAA
jgi:hypothetical protein